MRRTLALAALACSLAACKDTLGIGGSEAVYDLSAHTEITYTLVDHPPPQPTYSISHDYTGRLVLTRTAKQLKVVLTLQECDPSNECSTTYTFRSRDGQDPGYDGGTYFSTQVFNERGEGPYGFVVSGDMRPEGFTGTLFEMGGRYSPRGTFVATRD